MSRWLAGTLVAAALACSPAGPTVSLDQEFTLAPDEAARLSNTSTSIRFVGVFGDSRCPAGVLCIQGGDALVRIEALAPGSASRQYDLHTGDLQPVVHDGLTITLVRLMPYPFGVQAVQPGDYRATLRITR